MLLNDYVIEHLKVQTFHFRIVKMLKSDFDYRQRKFEKEALAKAKEEKRKRELAIRREQQARKRQEELDAKRRAKAEEQQRLKEEEESRKDKLRELNGGTFLETTLSPIPLPEETALALGIKRWVDKVQLPASVSAELMAQRASKNGALLFELTAENGRLTHAGVLDFSAPEGTVAIPPHVASCLWESGTCEGKVLVRYKRLLDGKFARLQPLKMGFHESVGEDLRDILEQRLSQQSVLTEGDILKIHLPQEDTPFELKVVELEPSSAVKILDTDLEVDVLPSEEVESLINERMKAATKSFHFTQRVTKPLEDELAKHDLIPEKMDIDEGVKPVVIPEKMDIEEVPSEVPHELPEEVAETEQDVILCSIRLPDGSSLRRRFRQEDSVSLLFQFLNAKVRNHLFLICMM